MDTFFKVPLYAKIALIFICLFAFVFILYVGQQIIIPIMFAIIIAILLNPLVNYLINKGLNKTTSITIVVTFTSILILLILYIISIRISMFSETYPQLVEKFNTTITELIHWISNFFDIRQSKVKLWMNETQKEAISNLAIGEKITAFGQMILTGMLLPVYIILILYYKPLLLEFIRSIFHLEHQVAVTEILSNAKIIIQSYLIGLLFEMIIVAVLNSIGLLLLGIEYAIILGIVGAVLNIIPYLGGIIAATITMVVAFITKDSLTYPLLVLALYIFVQFVDNNYLVPKIVASRVQINALVSVIVVLIGGTLWGISGMFLSIPLTAIIKVISDHIDPLKPFGLLLGDVVPTGTKFTFIKFKNSIKLKPKIK